MGRWKPDAKARLEQAALALYREHGFAQTTVAEIAEHLGCTTGVVAGLQARGLARLRQLVPDDIQEGP